MELKFYDCTQENLEKVYADYVKEVNDDHDCCICTNIICMVKWKKPKINCGAPTLYIDTEYKLMTSTLQIEWDDGSCYTHQTPFTAFWFGNVSDTSVIKFARMEDIDWDNM